jgi:hypothetical protein
MYRHCVITSCLLFFIFSCQKTPTRSDDEMLYSPVGIVITMRDSIVIQYRGAEEITGQLTTKIGTYSPKYSFRLIDVSGEFVSPAQETYELEARVEIYDIAESWLDGFDFYIKGKIAGRTNVILRVVSASAVLYTCKPVPIVITE